MATVKEPEPFVLRVRPGGPYDLWRRRKRARMGRKLPKNSDDYLYTLVDIYGSDKIRNMSEVDIADYIYNKGIIHAANINIGRNIPRIEDGLKSVERRIIYVMFAKGYYGRHVTKVATVAGDMIAMVYPHGERAPADTIFRIGNRYRMMIPYVRGELSNYGNMQDLKPAAARYADTALSAYSLDCFFGEIGPRRPLYDEVDAYNYQGKEPVSLISRYPNILLQWNLGIGKGAMAWLGAFNSKDLLEATLKLMDNPDADIHIYPDTPVPVEIVNRKELKDCFDQRAFNVQMRAPYIIETDERPTAKGGLEAKYTIVFTALPLGVTGDQVMQEVQKIKQEDAKATTKRLPEVLNIEPIADESIPGGIRVIVEYEYGYDPNALAEKLYKATSLAKTVSVQYNLVFDDHLEFRSPREILKIWINQRYDQKRRFYHQMVLKAAKDRAIYGALAIVLETREATDKAIAIIRSSKDDDESVGRLREAFGFTDFQARFIIERRLKTLQKLNVKEMIAARDQALADYKHYRKLLVSKNDEAIRDAIRGELEEGIARYGRSRMAKLRNLSAGLGDSEDEKYIFYNGSYYFCLEKMNKLRDIAERIDPTFRLVRVKNGDNVMLFGPKGEIKIINGYAFSPNDTGIGLDTLGMKDVVAIWPDTGEYDAMVFATAQGYGKVVELKEVTKSTKGKVITLNAGDRLSVAFPVNADGHPDSIVGLYQDDRLYYMKLTDLPVYKRSSAGNRLIKGVDDLDLQGGLYFPTTDDADFMLIYGDLGHIKLLDTRYLSFSKRGNNVISLGKRRILGATLLHGFNATITCRTSITDPPEFEIQTEIGALVKFIIGEGNEHRFKMSTSIGSPTRVLKLGRNDWYGIE